MHFSPSSPATKPCSRSDCSVQCFERLILKWQHLVSLFWQRSSLLSSQNSRITGGHVGFGWPGHSALGPGFSGKSLASLRTFQINWFQNTRRKKQTRVTKLRPIGAALGHNYFTIIVTFFTLGARGFSCAVSGFESSAFGRGQSSSSHARKNLW